MGTVDINSKERNLVVRLTQDDEEAFCELYSAYKHRIAYFTLKYLKSTKFADDVYQDAFIAVWESRRFINPDLSFATYLYTIVRNRILNLLRDMQSENELKEYVLSQAIDYSNNANEHITQSDLEAILQEAVSKLTERQREVFEMSRNQNMPHKEIAEHLGISLNTVQEHLSLALKSIRNYLTKYYGVFTIPILILCCLK
ncbi:MAG: RNA polymerase sigma-70 factor [Dysgonamonadaceae bacterium]|jgi:RNA polymerase sigma-70 factor (ECF subfamily)|nr:RNA polymerase sigma-70 factor [Dysgonamonadaceae bacterium]